MAAEQENLPACLNPEGNATGIYPSGGRGAVNICKQAHSQPKRVFHFDWRLFHS